MSLTGPLMCWVLFRAGVSEALQPLAWVEWKAGRFRGCKAGPRPPRALQDSVVSRPCGEPHDLSLRTCQTPLPRMEQTSKCPRDRVRRWPRGMGCEPERGLGKGRALAPEPRRGSPTNLQEG